jgi:hypothetical protein
MGQRSEWKVNDDAAMIEKLLELRRRAAPLCATR